MAGRMLRAALNFGREIRGKPKVDSRMFSSKPKFIEPGFDFGRPMFGPHYGITDSPIQPDGLPLYVNWYKVRGVMGCADDQGKTGTCYLCASLGAMSSVNCIATYDTTRESVPLSKQHVLDCGTLTDGDIDDGGFPDDVLKFAIKNGGILAASVYPYTGKVGPCKFKQGLGVTIDDWKAIRPNSELALRYALAFQPVIVDLRLDPRWIRVNGLLTKTNEYTSGTITGPSYYSRANHSVLLYGYGEDDKADPTWGGVNSWGVKWGTDGKFTLARGTGRGGGELGVLRNPIVPLKLSGQTRMVTARCESCPRCFRKWNKVL